MKRILITGANSYIGTSFEKYMSQWPDEYQVETVDMLDDTWRDKDFTGYDSVFHVAGIAHVKETKENAHIYYEVNRDLAVEVARKAKKEKVKQFVFLSSMSVYGKVTGIITKKTIPEPKTHYGKSKYEAEIAMDTLADDDFCLTIVRPPMVYGKNCKGNFQMMVKLVRKCPIFPVLHNERSMISIRNLCSFVRMIIDKEERGLFCPQNKEYVNTTHMAYLLAKEMNRKVFFSRLAGAYVHVLSPFVSILQKAFGTLTYEGLEQFGFCYCEETFEASVQRSI